MQPISAIEEAFLRSIMEHPDDDAPRLIFADRLEDHGQGQRAIFFPLPRGNSLNMKFIVVPRGTFWMGGGGGQPGDQQVTIEDDFQFGVYPVTQAQWQAVMPENPSYFSRLGNGQDAVRDSTDDELRQLPVACVSWDDAQEGLLLGLQGLLVAKGLLLGLH